jgi:hypothetical protein
VVLANVVGPWIHPDAIDVAKLVEIAHACPSGAIRYRRKDGGPDEAPPPVNLIAIREGGPYAVRADIKLDGDTAQTRFRATLCRCGASKVNSGWEVGASIIGVLAGRAPGSEQRAETHRSLRSCAPGTHPMFAEPYREAELEPTFAVEVDPIEMMRGAWRRGWSRLHLELRRAVRISGVAAVPLAPTLRNTTCVVHNPRRVSRVAARFLAQISARE